MPKVSVITALYNRSRFLWPRVESIVQQTLRDFEWIVIDDHSTDATFERFVRLTRSDRRILALRNARNIGQGPTTRKAFDLARGEYIYLTDDDDACHPTFLERMVGLLDAHPNLGLAYCGHRFMDARGGVWGGWPPRAGYLRSGEAEFRALLRRCHIRSPTSVLRRAAFERAAGFRTFVPPHNVDYHSYLKVCLVADAAFLGEPLAYYRLHPDQSRKSKFKSGDVVAVQERDSFDLISDVFRHLPADRRHLAELEREALWAAADSLLFSLLRLRREGMGETARALEAMICRRLPDYPIRRLRPGPIRMARLQGREIGLGLLRRATYVPPARPERRPDASAGAREQLVARAAGSAPAEADRAVGSVSIIVCVRDQAEALDACLDRLVRLQPPERAEVEIVVVDNRSLDQARRVVERPRPGARFPIRYLLEPVPGLARARNRGVRSVRSEVVAFLDADCLAAADWIARICEEFDADPHASILGGRVELYDRRDRNVTIKGTTHRQVMAAVGQLDGFLHGCNFAFRRRVVETIGLFDVRLGKGGPARSAEDADFVYRGFRAGLKVAYSPLCVVAHNHGRRTPAAEDALRRIYRIGTGAVRTKHALAGDRAMLAWAVQDYLRCLRAALRATIGHGERDRPRLRQLAHYLLGAALFLRYRHLASDSEPALLGEANRDPVAIPN
jgi:glycosyltransferase involved in cell wall biosynthesis